jgi:hypothetical protein
MNVPKNNPNQKSVFLLQHCIVGKNGACNIKVIGIFTNMRSVRSAVKILSNAPGFKDNNKIVGSNVDENESGFYIDEMVTNRIYWDAGFITDRS